MDIDLSGTHYCLYVSGVPDKILTETDMRKLPVLDLVDIRPVGQLGGYRCYGLPGDLAIGWRRTTGELALGRFDPRADPWVRQRLPFITFPDYMGRWGEYPGGEPRGH